MSTSSQVKKVSLNTLCRKWCSLELENVPAISNILCSSYDILKNQKITGFYMHINISRTAYRYLKNFKAKISLDEGTKSIYKFSNNKPTMV